MNNYDRFAITYCECVENHVGMEQLGTKASTGISPQQLYTFYLKFKAYGATYHDLAPPGGVHDGVAYESAPIVYFPKFVETIFGPTASDDHLRALQTLEWDWHATMYGRVVEKKARHNLCFANIDRGPNYEAGQGRVVSMSPWMRATAAFLETEFQLPPQLLKAEGNRYWDPSCYIGYHGDTERSMVFGITYGSPAELGWNWFHQGQPVGPLSKNTVTHGSLYIMSRKAVGDDWKKKIIPTLRHSAALNLLPSGADDSERLKANDRAHKLWKKSHGF